MIKRLAFGLMLSMLGARHLSAATLPDEAWSRIPFGDIPWVALDALCTYLEIICA